jgi:phosphatidate cytidylyltransferase
MGTKLLMVFTLLICVCSDIGGLTFGKIFKGKKLTKLSPNKTISGSVGSFIFSLFFMLIFILLNLIELNFTITLYVLATSMFCQIGDIFISYMKRKANVKDTGNILPGHGGLLDRVDGILFAVPLGIFVFYLLSI